MSNEVVESVICCSSICKETQSGDALNNNWLSVRDCKGGGKHVAYFQEHRLELNNVDMSLNRHLVL